MRRGAASLLIVVALLGCNATTASAPPPASPTPATSAAPTPAPTATPAPSESPSAASPERAAQVLAAFFELAARTDNEFRLRQEGVLHSGGTPVAVFAYDLAVSGEDAAGTLTVGGGTLDIVVIGAKAWVRQGSDGPWTPTSRAIINGDEIVDIFRYVGAEEDLEFVAVDRGGDDPQFHYRATGPLPYETAEIRDAGGTGSMTRFDLYLAPDGTPLRFGFDFEATRPTASGESKATGSATVSFIDWGLPVAIEPPELP